MTTPKRLYRAALAASVLVVCACGGGGGGGGGGDGGGASYPYYLFVTNPAGSGASASSIHVVGIADDGSLHQVRTYAGQGRYLHKLVATPDGRFLYAVDGRFTVDDEEGSVRGYAVGAGGTLTPLPGSPYPAGLDPTDMAIEPGGRYAYVTADGSDAVFAYRIGDDGALQALPGAVPDLTLPVRLAVLCAGNDVVGHTTQVLVQTDWNRELVRLVMNDNGSLTRLQTVTAGANTPALLSAGRVAYLADTGDTVLGLQLQYSLGWHMGLTPGSPWALPATPRALVLSPAADRLYALVDASSTDGLAAVVTAELDGSGGITASHAGPSVGFLPMGLAVHPAGGQLLAAHFDDTSPSPAPEILRFPISADGSPAAAPAQAFHFSPAIIGSIEGMLILPAP